MLERQPNTTDPFAHYIISRKRKKYKFAHFDNYTNTASHAREDDPAVVKEKLDPWLSSSKPLILEIAAGNAQFSLALAKKYPDYNFIAIDIKSDRLYTSAKQALEEGVENTAFLRMSMHELQRVFPKKSVDAIWLTFPDPFMRKRSMRRRLSHEQFLRQYRIILNDTGKLHFKTDSRDLFLWSLEQLVADKWHITELSFDLHESNLPEDYKIMTYYESRFAAEGIPINYGTFIPQYKT